MKAVRGFGLGPLFLPQSKNSHGGHGEHGEMMNKSGLGAYMPLLFTSVFSVVTDHAKI